MKVIAISGGVDSILLAYKYRNKNIVLAFVNYNLRNDTHIDEKIVSSFAKKYNLKLEKLILDGNYPKGNFENLAREIRYNFFLEVYKKYKCNELLIAHHKDDFLETCIMQKQKNENKLFYGIKKATTFKGMKIRRPFIDKYWKNDIYELANKYKLEFNDDYTNFDPKYTRNKIRLDLLKWSTKDKEKHLKEFNSINDSNIKLIKTINKEYAIWRKSKFDIMIFNDFKNKEELLKSFINKRLKDVNLNKHILNNILSFITSSNNKKTFLLTNGNLIVKKNKKLYIKKSNL